jgi:hypothetical protein
MFRLYHLAILRPHTKTYEQNTRTLHRIFLVIGARVVLPSNQSLGRIVLKLRTDTVIINH